MSEVAVGNGENICLCEPPRSLDNDLILSLEVSAARALCFDSARRPHRCALQSARMAGLPNGDQRSLRYASILTCALPTGSIGASEVVLENSAPTVDDPKLSSQAVFVRGSRDKSIGMSRSELRKSPIAPVISPGRVGGRQRVGENDERL
jgi:hypothetical protein